MNDINKLTINEMMDLWYKYYPIFVAEIQYQLIWAPKRSIPWLKVTKDITAYTDSKNIVIGLGIVKEIFEPKTEEDFVLAVLYLIGHEVGHIKHTPNKPWIYGLNEGVRQICIKWSEKLEGKGHRRFVKESDIDNFLTWLNKNKNITVNKDSLKNICHQIQNSLEDGREERLEAKTDAAFKARMRICRGKFWNKQPIDTMSVIMAKLSGTEFSFTMKSAQVLSLATTALYQKGFFNVFDENSNIYKGVEELVPYIAKAVTAPTCRKGIEMAIEIEKLLADDILAAAQASSQNCNKSNGANGNSNSCSSGNNTSNETTNGNTDDLSDVLDALSKAGAGLPTSDKEQHGMMKNEMPGEESEDNNDNSNSNADTSVFGNGLTDLNGKVSMDSNNNETSTDSDSNSDDNKTAKKESSGCIYNHDVQRSGARNVGDTANAVSDIAATEAAVLEAMKDAAANASGLITSITKSVKKPSTPFNFKKEYPVIPIPEIKEKYPKMHFEEHQREYNLRLPLPADLLYRAENFRKNIEELLHNKMKTNYDLRKGDLDSGNLYKLLLGDCEIFSEDSTPNDFDGACYILQDNSGSMGYGSGSKREYACEATAICEYALSDLMPLKITAFDSQGTNFIVHEVVKDFDEVQPKDISCSYNFLMQGRSGCGNTDGYDIRIATEELLSRKDKKKLLIVLSDGAPSGYAGRTGINDVKSAVEDARKAGVIVIGIYFADNLCDEEVAEYRQMYGDDIIATTPDKIEVELAKLMKTFYFD